MERSELLARAAAAHAYHAARNRLPEVQARREQDRYQILRWRYTVAAEWADRIETARRAREPLAEFMLWLQIPAALEQAVREILERRRAARRSLARES